MLSPAAMVTSFATMLVSPSTFRRKREPYPVANVTDSRRTASLPRLYTFSWRVVVPIWVNTVSNAIVSHENSSASRLPAYRSSFWHDTNIPGSNTATVRTIKNNLLSILFLLTQKPPDYYYNTYFFLRGGGQPPQPPRPCGHSPAEPLQESKSLQYCILTASL